MKELIGKTITGLRISEGEEILSFDTKDGCTFVYRAYGDCCSETWFADITGVSALIGGTVASADFVDMDGTYNVDDGRGRQDYDQAYGVKIMTDRGHADIIYRNSSNGYYGGDIELVSERYSDECSTQITDDWTA